MKLGDAAIDEATRLEVAPEPPQELTHEESVEAILKAIDEGKIDERRLLIEIYLYMHEMKSIMSSISSGKLSGILGKMLGGR